VTVVALNPLNQLLLLLLLLLLVVVVSFSLCVWMCLL
jgi:hypothetical protein